MESKGFELYYSHFTEQHLIPENRVPLSSGLMPVVNFKTVKRKYLGYPYTTCFETESTNDYHEWNNWNQLNEFNEVAGEVYSQRYSRQNSSVFSGKFQPENFRAVSVEKRHFPGSGFPGSIGKYTGGYSDFLRLPVEQVPIPGYH